MPSFFKQHSVEVLEARRREVDREIAGLILFRDKIERRIAVLREKQK